MWIHKPSTCKATSSMIWLRLLYLLWEYLIDIALNPLYCCIDWSFSSFFCSTRIYWRPRKNALFVASQLLRLFSNFFIPLYTLPLTVPVIWKLIELAEKYWPEQKIERWVDQKILYPTSYEKVKKFQKLRSKRFDANHIKLKRMIRMRKVAG